MAAASMAGLWRNADGVQGLVHTSHPMTRSCYRIITIKPVLTEQHEIRIPTKESTVCQVYPIMHTEGCLQENPATEGNLAASIQHGSLLAQGCRNMKVGTCRRMIMVVQVGQSKCIVLDMVVCGLRSMLTGSKIPSLPEAPPPLLLSPLWLAPCGADNTHPIPFDRRLAIGFIGNTQLPVGQPAQPCSCTVTRGLCCRSSANCHRCNPRIMHAISPQACMVECTLSAFWACLTPVGPC